MTLGCYKGQYIFVRYLIRTNYPERELKRINHSKTALIRLPTHVGCAFAVDREFFYEIGSYDEGMDIWGSENLDLALRVSIFTVFIFELFILFAAILFLCPFQVIGAPNFW